MPDWSLPRFYPILDTGLLERAGVSPPAAADTLLQAGARILQFRHKGRYSRGVFEQAERIATLCASAGASLVINDRADIAALLRAALHLGQDDLPPADARLVVGAATIVGLSTHNEAQFRSAAPEPVDYLAFGPIFQTGSKQNPDPVVGVEELRRLRPLTARPLVAIGGITRTTAAAVLEAGADSVAIISDLLPLTRGRAEEWVRLTAG